MVSCILLGGGPWDQRQMCLGSYLDANIQTMRYSVVCLMRQVRPWPQRHPTSTARMILSSPSSFAGTDLEKIFTHDRRLIGVTVYGTQRTEPCILLLCQLQCSVVAADLMELPPTEIFTVISSRPSPWMREIYYFVMEVDCGWQSNAISHLEDSFCCWQSNAMLHLGN